MKFYGGSLPTLPPPYSDWWTTTPMPVNLPPNSELSEMDKACMVTVYPRQTPHNTVPEWTLDHAFQIAGIDSQAAQAIKAAFAAGDIAGGRSIFFRYLVNSRLALPIVIPALVEKLCGSPTPRSRSDSHVYDRAGACFHGVSEATRAGHTVAVHATFIFEVKRNQHPWARF
ncbi:hypothetical protein K438DRAFT_1925355 [Mycena galopus ATCC 62051]|nr:hypothetical protein K438DRAFT_1925355 [Mycena galopus ATCC 62051]